MSIRRYAALACCLAALASPCAFANPATTFTYQGLLAEGGGRFSGVADIRFTLFDAATAGTQVGPTLTAAGVMVTDGLVTIDLDFGAAAFNGDARWLEVEVATASSGNQFERLTPRQAVRPAPYAQRELAGGGGGGGPLPAGAMIFFDSATARPGFTFTGNTLQTTASWRRIAPLSAARAITPTCPTIGTKIHLLEGIFARHEVLDTETNTFALLPQLPTQVVGYFPVTDGESIFIVGGASQIGNVPTADCWRWSSTSQAWSPFAPLPSPRTGAVTAFDEGKLFAIAGQLTNGINTNTVTVCDVGTGTWSIAPSLPATGIAGAAYAHAGTIYVLGGFLNGGASAAVYAFDIASSTWSTRASMIAPRQGFGSALLDDKIYVFGGNVAGVPSDSVDVYDTQADTWQRLPAPLNGPRFAVAGGSGAGRVYAFGGLINSPFTLFDTAEVLQPGAELFVHKKD